MREPSGGRLPLSPPPSKPAGTIAKSSRQGHGDEISRILGTHPVGGAGYRLPARWSLRYKQPMPSVLIIEDDPDMRTLERMALEGDGYDVATANDGAQGLQSLRNQRPCVILLDLMMPVMDGLTFLAERRRAQIAEHVPVICVSAAGPELMARARVLGATACLDKPTDFNSLCELVGRLCRRQ